MYFDYFTALVFASVGFVFVFANVAIGSIIRPKRKTDVGLEVYECGEEVRDEAWVNFDMRYYTVALVYVVFAVEIAFLFPWALVLNEAIEGTGAAAGKDIGVFAVIEGMIFITILLLGLAYVWAKGDLDWILHYEGKHFEPAHKTSHRAAIPTVHELHSAAEGGGEEEGEAGEAQEAEEVTV